MGRKRYGRKARDEQGFVICSLAIITGLIYWFTNDLWMWPAFATVLYTLWVIYATKPKYRPKK